MVTLPSNASISSSQRQEVTESGEAGEEKERTTEENIFRVRGEVVVSSRDCQGEAGHEVAKIQHSEALECSPGQLADSGVSLQAVDC